METLKKTHWDILYDVEPDQKMNWYQEVPVTSVQLIDSWAYSSNAQIIDVGGGNTNLAEQLINKGYKNITVLDISGESLRRVKDKLGGKSVLVNWISTDILDFESVIQYDVWHDRATFHFLKDEKDIDNYIDIVSQGVVHDGYFIVSAFSGCGPQESNGIEVKRYNEEDLKDTFSENFELVESFIEDHETPYYSYQQFIYGVFRRK